MGKVAPEYDYYPAPKQVTEKEFERRWAKAFGKDKKEKKDTDKE